MGLGQAGVVPVAFDLEVCPRLPEGYYDSSHLWTGGIFSHGTEDDGLLESNAEPFWPASRARPVPEWTTDRRLSVDRRGGLVAPVLRLVSKRVPCMADPRFGRANS